MSTRGMDPGELMAAVERSAQSAVAGRHRHVFRTIGPSDFLPGFDVERCKVEGCPKIHHRRQEAS